MKPAEEVRKGKNKLLMELSTLYANGIVSKKEVGALVGKEIADEMEFIHKKAKESLKKGIEYGQKLEKRSVRV